MKYFVNKNSIVREIWGKADTVLFIFAGASAEFALNKAVDWLYFTGRLPSDPLGRLFSTVSYARDIIFAERDAALSAIDKITAIHQGVEQARGSKIPDWAYRDVLFMLVDYSIRSYELLERRLKEPEKQELFSVFYEMGSRMQIADLPTTYGQWLGMRKSHLKEHLAFSDCTADLYRQYRKHLGLLRYLLLRQVQILLVPERVNKLLSLGRFPLLLPAIGIYKLSRKLAIEGFLKEAILPLKYKKEIKELDMHLV